jgi:hypothetical protein
MELQMSSGAKPAWDGAAAQGPQEEPAGKGKGKGKGKWKGKGKDKAGGSRAGSSFQVAPPEQPATATAGAAAAGVVPPAKSKALRAMFAGKKTVAFLSVCI